MNDDMKPQVQAELRVPVDDHEGQMARADLYRAAKHAMKLFEMIQEGQELEGWVQAKITKSADYLDSVYHYMEYQMKFGEGATAKSLDDITGEASIASKDAVSEEDDEQEMKESNMNYEQKLQALLEGAMKKEMKKKPAKKDDKVDEAKFQASGVRATDKKKGKVDKTLRKAYFLKFEKDGRTKGVTMVADEGESLGDLKDRAKRENMGWTLASVREKEPVGESKDADDAKKAEAEKKKKEEKKKKIAKIVDEGKSEAQKAAQEKFKAMVSKKKGSDKKEKAEESLVKNIVKKVVEAKKAKKDYDGDGQVETPADEYKGSRDKAIKKAMAKKEESVESAKEVVAESADLARIKKLAKHLLG